MIVCRHLLIPLVAAERAWALSMALKSDLEKTKNPRKRLHLVCTMHTVSRGTIACNSVYTHYNVHILG